MRIIQSEHPRPLNLLAISSGGLVAAASSTFGVDGGVEVWDATRGEQKWEHATTAGGFRFVGFVLDGTHFFAADQSGESLLVLRGEKDIPAEIARTSWSEAVLVAAGDRVFVVRSSADTAVACWGLPKLNLLWKYDHWDYGTQFGVLPALDPVSMQLALVVRQGNTHPIQFISVRDANTGKPRWTVPTDAADPIRQFAFTADGAKLLARTDNRTVQMFDAATGAAAGELVHPGRPYVTGIAVHPRGIVACARTNGTVTFWDAEKREQLRTFDWKAGKLVSVAFAPDGALAAAGTEDGKIVVWDVDG